MIFEIARMNSLDIITTSKLGTKPAYLEPKLSNPFYENSASGEVKNMVMVMFTHLHFL